ncbi:MAG: dihydroneopterin aldolase family protein [Candidatus Nezhaarchaeales archaeon]
MDSSAEPDEAKRFFDKTITDRERAIFEAGVCLGAIYHQVVGLPISKDKRLLRAVESTIEKAFSLQPFKEKVSVKIRTRLIKGSKKHPYDYDTIKGHMLDIHVVSKYGGFRAIGRMRYIPRMKYTLAYVEKVESINKP